MPTLFVAFEDRIRRLTVDDGAWTGETVLDDVAPDAIAAHPDAPDRILLGTIETGLHRSEDGGVSWDRVGQRTIADRVTALASDPSDPETFYVGTEPSQVYVTTDAGDAWHHLEGLADVPSASTWAFPPRPSTHHVRWIEVEPDDPDHIYVAIEAGALVRSFDGGETWKDRVPSGPQDTHTMTTHPAVPNRAWAAAGDGFAVTDDRGETWTYPQTRLDHRYCWSVAVGPRDPERILLSAASGPRSAHTSGAAESYVYRRTGEGPWTLAADGLPHGNGMLRPVIQRGFEPGVAYLATNLGVWRTPDMGGSWAAINDDWLTDVESQTVRGLTVLG